MADGFNWAFKGLKYHQSNILNFNIHCTGCFVMYSWIAKIYDRKTVGHVFTKPVQIEGTTQKIFLSNLFFMVFHISAAGCLCTQTSIGRPLTAKDDERVGTSFLHSQKKTGNAAKELSSPFDSVPLR
jgi:hypothetical protein